MVKIAFLLVDSYNVAMPAVPYLLQLAYIATKIFIFSCLLFLEPP